MLLKLISTAILALTVLSLGQGAVAILPSPCVSMSFLLTCRSCAETRLIALQDPPCINDHPTSRIRFLTHLSRFKISSLLFGPAQACLTSNLREIPAAPAALASPSSTPFLSITSTSTRAADPAGVVRAVAHAPRCARASLATTRTNPDPKRPVSDAKSL
ncbi:hypothetical protein FB451DRAFT_1550601 [Mycena latifolia]|nr:hypothetical protein FB451DRAFT_1550601 [Mycena latifolia]